jgi:hypothetical protein
MKEKLIRWLVGVPTHETGSERIGTLRDAIKWRLGGLPWLDASVRYDGSVSLYLYR